MGSFGHFNEPLGSVKGEEFLDLLNDCSVEFVSVQYVQNLLPVLRDLNLLQFTVLKH